jgi:hypothetical protein
MDFLEMDFDPGDSDEVSVLKPSSSSLMPRQNKLERLALASFSS